MAAAFAGEVVRDVQYAEVDGIGLKLDLHKAAVQRGPVIVWIHGGAWRSGSKSEMPLGGLVADGFPVASVGYRLSTVARFPAQVHDIKAAIRFLRGESKRFGIDTKTIVIAGASAGGHLAALVGVSNEHKELEGEIGEQRSESSSVQGVISFYGGSDLTTILSQSTPHGLKVRVPALELLLGGQPDTKVELARLASPVFHVDANDPPLLLFHGDQDNQMPVNQALQLVGAYEKHGRPVRLKILHGAGHGGKEFYAEAQLEIVKDFLGTVKVSAK
jgi:acetyl esterase/lipase